MLLFQIKFWNSSECWSSKLNRDIVNEDVFKLIFQDRKWFITLNENLKD